MWNRGREKEEQMFPSEILNTQSRATNGHVIAISAVNIDGLQGINLSDFGDSLTCIITCSVTCSVTCIITCIVAHPFGSNYSVTQESHWIMEWIILIYCKNIYHQHSLSLLDLCPCWSVHKSPAPPVGQTLNFEHKTVMNFTTNVRLRLLSCYSRRTNCLQVVDKHQKFTAQKQICCRLHEEYTGRKLGCGDGDGGRSVRYLIPTDNSQQPWDQLPWTSDFHGAQRIGPNDMFRYTPCFRGYLLIHSFGFPRPPQLHMWVIRGVML